MREFFHQTYSIILERLRYAETKNTILLTILGVLIIGSFRIYNETPYRPLVATVYFWIFLVFSFLAMVTVLTSFMPNIKLQYLYKTKDPLPTDSLIYYEHIAKFDDAKQYVSAVNKVYFNNEGVPTNLDYDLAAQIILNSRSTYRKSVISYYAIVLTVCSLLTPVVGGIYLFFSTYFYWSSESGRMRLKFGRRKQKKEEIKEIRNNPFQEISRRLQRPYSSKNIRNVFPVENIGNPEGAENSKSVENTEPVENSKPIEDVK